MHKITAPQRADNNFSNKYFNIRLTQLSVPYLRTATCFRFNRRRKLIGKIFKNKEKCIAYGFTVCHYYCVTFLKFLNKRQVDFLDGILKYFLLNLLEPQRAEFYKIGCQIFVVLRNTSWDNICFVLSISFSLKYLMFVVYIQEYWFCYTHKSWIWPKSTYQILIII
jgi:hypothetical protein